MDRLAAYSRLVDAVAVFSALYLIRLAETHLEKIGAHTSVILIAAFIILVVSVRLLAFLASQALNYIPLLPRLILGPSNIQGIWFNTIPVDGDTFCGLFVVSLTDGRVRVVGEQFDKAGLVRVTWTSVMTQFDGDTLRFVYQARYTVRNMVERFGFSTYTFIRSLPGKQLATFNGQYVDLSTNFESDAFSGFKITDKATLRSLNDPATRAAAVTKLLQTRCATPKLLAVAR
ncbi:MAG: hypothetical protein JWN40_2403 [Phycisphaerales bacterium]|nr:hypothetical protein [Phycisphaerales bacterium]